MAYLFIHLKDRFAEKEREDTFQMLVHSSEGHSDQDWSS